MVNSYDFMQGDPMDPEDHPAHNVPDASVKYAGEVIPIKPSNLERDIAGARRQVESERSFKNIGSGQSFSTNNLTVFKPK